MKNQSTAAHKQWNGKLENNGKTTFLLQKRPVMMFGKLWPQNSIWFIRNDPTELNPNLASFKRQGSETSATLH
jgi:hypothetical protein